MMTRKKLRAGLILAFVLSLILVGTFYVLLAPGKWSKEIVKYLNDNILEENGWRISVENLDGQLTSDVHFKNLYLRKEDGSIVLFSEHAKVNLDFSQILSGDWAISELTLDNALITVKKLKVEEEPKLLFVNDLVQHGFKIREFTVGKSALILKEGEKETLYSFSFAGNVSTSGDAIVFSPHDFNVTDLKSNSNIHVTEGDFAMETSSLQANGIKGFLNNHPINLNGVVILSPATKVSLDVTARRIAPNDYVQFDLSDVLEADTIDLQIQLETDMSTTLLQGLIYDSKTYAIMGDIDVNLSREGTDILLNHGGIKIQSLELEGEGILSSNRDLQLHLRVNKLDLAGLDVFSKPTNISGSVDLTGSIDKYQIEKIKSDVLLQNNQQGDTGFFKASGIITYKNNIVEIPEPLTLDLSYGVMTVQGKINLNNERLNISLTTEDADIQPVAYVLGLTDSLSGRIRGTVELSGYLKDPSVNGYLVVEEGALGKTEVNSLSMSFLVNSLIKNRHGSLKAVASEGLIGDHRIDTASLDVYFRGDTILVANVRLEGGNDYIQASGRIVGTKSLVIDQIQSSLRDQYIRSVGPLVVHRDSNDLFIEPAFIRINDGTIKGSLSFRDRQLKDGSFHLINLSLASLEQILDGEFAVVGAVFADFNAETIDDHLKVEGTFEVKDGLWNDISFNNLLVTGDFKDNKLNIKEMRLSAPDGMTLELSGLLSTTRDSSGVPRIDSDGEIELSSEFRNFNLTLLDLYLPEWWKLGGSASGSLAMSGKANSSEMVFEMTITEPRFDKIHAETISASGRYMDHRLFFEDLEGYTSTGHFTGEGYLPVDFAFFPVEEDRFIEIDPISMSFHAKTINLDFLTTYFSDIDSVKGDIEIDLSIEGTPISPIRNGQFAIGNGQIYALLLDFPIYQVDGKAILKDNKFIIEKLEGTSYMPASADWASDLRSSLSKISGGILFSREADEQMHNLRVTGSMDMEEFFHPNLAFLITGEDVYVRTLLGEIEGIADVNLSVTGKDTINMVGDIVPSKAILRMEFTGEGDYEEIEHQGTTVSWYNLHFPIAGNLFIRNSQIDAELDGDMTIYKLGTGPYRYSGELNILGGKFYYGSDKFDIQEGHLVFDPTKFNPKMDIRATTRISDIDIEVALTGDFDEPSLVVEDSKQFYSQSDLLQLLTFQKRFEDQDLSTGSLSEQSAFLFGKYLENELERSLVRATPILDEFEIEGSESILNPSEESDLALKVGTRLTSNLYLSYKQKFSPTQPNQVGVEYRLNRNISLVVTYDEDGQVHLKYRRKYQF